MADFPVFSQDVPESPYRETVVLAQNCSAPCSKALTAIKHGQEAEEKSFNVFINSPIFGDYILSTYSPWRRRGCPTGYIIKHAKPQNSLRESGRIDLLIMPRRGVPQGYHVQFQISLRGSTRLKIESNINDAMVAPEFINGVQVEENLVLCGPGFPYVTRQRWRRRAQRIGSPLKIMSLRTLQLELDRIHRHDLME